MDVQHFLTMISKMNLHALKVLKRRKEKSGSYTRAEINIQRVASQAENADHGGFTKNSVGKISIIAVYATSFLLFSENDGNQMEASNAEIIGTMSCLPAIILSVRAGHWDACQ